MFVSARIQVCLCVCIHVCTCYRNQLANTARQPTPKLMSKGKGLVHTQEPAFHRQLPFRWKGRAERPWQSGNCDKAVLDQYLKRGSEQVSTQGGAQKAPMSISCGLLNATQKKLPNCQHALESRSVPKSQHWPTNLDPVCSGFHRLELDGGYWSLSPCIQLCTGMDRRHWDNVPLTFRDWLLSITFPLRFNINSRSVPNNGWTWRPHSWAYTTHVLSVRTW
jgi:hypothetical protein